MCTQKIHGDVAAMGGSENRLPFHSAIVMVAVVVVVVVVVGVALFLSLFQRYTARSTCCFCSFSGPDQIPPVASSRDN
jgi:hypothetical protein